VCCTEYRVGEEEKKNVEYGNLAGFMGYKRKQACDIQNLINERQI
jgi:hypothetical protein